MSELIVEEAIFCTEVEKIVLGKVQLDLPLYTSADIVMFRLPALDLSVMLFW
jgi:hypothetical protein